MYHVYIIYSQKLDKFYIGYTENILKRIEWHNSAEFQNAFTTRGIPWTIKILIPCATSSEARKIESLIKKRKSRKYIIDLIQYPELVDKLKSKV